MATVEMPRIGGRVLLDARTWTPRSLW